MSEHTAEAMDALEQAAATLLGRLLLEFSRLDMALGLCLVWTGGGHHIDSLTKQVAEFNLHKRLDYLGQVVDRSFPENSEIRDAYITWLGQAHAARQKRNELVHGRWGFDLGREQLVNVVGLPTSSEQREIRYSVADLEGILDDVRRLRIGLDNLRKQWPL